jgi:FAD/FMN-containing dehydrogenase
MMPLIELLRSELGPESVLTGDAVSARLAGAWGRPEPLRARALLRPADTHALSTALRLCHAARQPVVIVGGGSGLVEGHRTGPDDIALSLERLDRIESIDLAGRTLTAQAGVVLERIQRAAEEAGLLFPLDLGARGSATIGGNVATNAGGNRVLRYGMTRQLVLGLEVVLADGTVVSSLNRLLKNNAGYDLKQLFIGSEGTLGVVTRVVLRLLPQPRSHLTAVAACDDFPALAGLLGHMDAALGGTLGAFEVLWGDYLRFLLEPGSPHRAPLPTSHAYYVLLDMLGGDPAGDPERFESALAGALEAGLVADAVLAKSRAEQAAWWSLRDDVFRLQQLRPLFMFDVGVPISEVEGYVANVQGRLQREFPGSTCHVFGHLGDGNLHLGVSAGPEDGSARHAVEEAVYRPLAAFGGSVSAEHGIGLEKRDWLAVSRNEGEIALMRLLKQSLDPRGILNPGRVLAA